MPSRSPPTARRAALLDADGELALPVLDYEHRYPGTFARSLRLALRPTFAETFSPRLPCGLNLGAQLHYQKTVFPERLRRGRDHPHLSAILGLAADRR